jgi:hypothetical protein
LEAEPQLAGLVEKHGSNAVWHAGLDLFGYPPTWMLSVKDLIDLNRFLERNRK